MRIYFYMDASALIKRYVKEIGTPNVNRLFELVPRTNMVCLILGTLEAISVFVRKKNAKRITPAVFNQAMTDFRNEVLDQSEFKKINATERLVYSAATLIQKHSINATDAIVLRSAMNLSTGLRALGNDLVLVASDQRLLKAAQAEGLKTFDPENQPQTALEALLGS